MGRARNAGVQVLARVLLQVGPPDTDALGRPVLPDLHPAVLADRQLVLRNLVALRQVRVEVVLAGEPVHRRDRAVQRQPCPDSELDRLLIDDRQDPRHPQAHWARLGVRRRAEHRAAPAEHLGRSQQLRVRLQPDNDVVRHEPLGSPMFFHGRAPGIHRR